jgi:hypothetical protein
VSFAAGLTLLGFTLVNFLTYNSYPLLRPELGYFYTGLLLLCAAMAALYSRRGPRGRAFLEALLISVAVDMNMDSLWLTAGAFLVALAFVGLKRQSVLPFATVMGAVMLVLSLAGVGEKRQLIERTESPRTRPAAQQPPGPAIVHIIFDEHTGFEGFADASAATAAMKSDLRQFYESRGFAMFGRAYSEHYFTANSIPQILNLGGPAPEHVDPRRPATAGPTRYLTLLRQRGYAVRIYQSEYLDLCKSAVEESCTTYDVLGAGSLLYTPLNRRERGQVLFFKFLMLSDALVALDEKIPDLLELLYPERPIEAPLKPLGYTWSIASALAMDRLIEDLHKAKPGEVYIAHLVLPHFPWAFDPSCNIRPLRDWDRRVVRFAGQRRERGYFDQIRCTLRKTDRLLDVLASSPAGRDSVVIIHGDHGSRNWLRIPSLKYFRVSQLSDYLAAYSTLFAVRSPGLPSTYVEAPAPVADLLRQLIESEFRAVPTPPPGPPLVYAADEDWRPRKRIELPESWWKNSAATSQAGTQQTEAAAGPEAFRVRNTLKKDPW